MDCFHLYGEEFHSDHQIKKGVYSGVFSPSPAAPCKADTGMVLMIVVPGLEVVGVTPRIVDLVGVDPACAVLRMVVCLPSADVTNFKMVPAGRGPFV